ncbi:MAG: T9SS type A sorting domain-containing protein [Prevotella sp.]
MKHIILGFFISFVSICCQAQGIASTIQLQDGTIVDRSHIFLDGEAPLFHVQDIKSDDLTWTLSFYNESGGKTVCLESDAGADQFTFKIEPSLFSGLYLDFQRIEYPNDSSVYIICSVELHRGDIIIDSLPLTLNVLPSRPKVIKASIAGDFDFEYGGYEPYGELAVQFSAERMNECIMFFYHSDSLNVFQFPETFGGNYEFVDVNEVCKNIYEFKYGYADWGQFYSIDAYNQYGGVQGDTIFTTSLIENPEILSYLETIQSQIAGIAEVQDEDMRIYLNNNKLIIDGTHNMPISTDIYTANGTLINRYFSTNTIDLNDLCTGAYIVKIKLDDKTITRKIIKN